MLPSKSWNILFKDQLTVKLQIYYFAKFDLVLFIQMISARIFVYEIGLNLGVTAIVIEKNVIFTVFFLEIRS